VSAAKSFTGIIREGRGGGAFIEVPFDVKEAFGSARPKVVVTFDGEPYRGTIAPMGGASLIGILKDIRARIGKDIGDEVRVTVEADTAPREVLLPDDVRSALEEAELLAQFEKLSYTHRKEHINAVEEAKQPATRQRRVDKLIEILRAPQRP
jgi:hypothetical protein